jgi:large subunit ribosomal protein L19e
MGGLSLQRRLAADILKVGETRIWVSPSHLDEIKNSITRSDVRRMINHGYIKAKTPKIKRPKERVKKTKGPGRRKGAKGARTPKKEKWMNTVRPLRRMLKKLRDENKIDVGTYRKLYSQVKSGTFRNRSHLKLYLKQRGILNETGT